jgi:two-component sensor histidine kinase/ActR/RegA family two-component response regulator
VTFLIVDDNPGDRELIVRYLRREFPEDVFVEVFRRQEFEDALACGGIDVVFTDYQLHWTDGLWILRKCQEHWPHTPVIMFTDTGGEEIAVEGMKAGLSDYLLKSHPFRLPVAVKESLEKIRLRQAHEEAQEALRQANEGLEANVAARTRELQQLNETLIADNAMRQRTEQQLQVLLKEKEVLLKEMHHRVKNNLQIIASLLRLQADAVNDPHVQKIFKDSQHRINTMVLIHETLYQAGDVAHIEFAAYIRSLVTQLLEASGSRAERIALHIEAEAVSLELTTAIPCGLLLNELVTNCLKHAFPYEQAGEIRVALQRGEDRHVRLRVSDTGVGFPAGLDFRATDSLGLQLVCLLTEQLQGTLTLDRRSGTHWTLTFPHTPNDIDEEAASAEASSV